MKIKEPLCVDTSAWESNVIWENVKPLPVIAINRATYGQAYIDPTLRDYFQQWQDLGIWRGCYMFMLPDVSVKNQVHKYFEAVDGAGGHGELPPILDVEDTKLSVNAVRIALDMLENEYQIPPMIYTSKSKWDRIVGSNHDWCAKYPLWAAWYPFSAFVDLNHTLPADKIPHGWGDDRWALWQYSEAGRLEGIPHDGVDFNMINPWYYAELIGAPLPQPAPQPAPVYDDAVKYVGQVLWERGCNMRPQESTNNFAVGTLAYGEQFKGVRLAPDRNDPGNAQKLWMLLDNGYWIAVYYPASGGRYIRASWSEIGDDPPEDPNSYPPGDDYFIHFGADGTQRKFIQSNE